MLAILLALPSCQKATSETQKGSSANSSDEDLRYQELLKKQREDEEKVMQDIIDNFEPADITDALLDPFGF